MKQRKSRETGKVRQRGWALETSMGPGDGHLRADGCRTNLCLRTEFISVYETGGGISVPLS